MIKTRNLAGPAQLLHRRQHLQEPHRQLVAQGNLLVQTFESIIDMPYSKLKTFRDLIKGNEDQDDEDDEKYFAGGEKSGVMMQGGPSQKRDASDLVKDILTKAARYAAISK
jgi:hypothetical protein